MGYIQKLGIGVIAVFMVVGLWSEGKAQIESFIEDTTLRDNAIQNFPVEEYFQNIQIHSITIDNRGLVYFAQAKGIVEFDGVEWRMISIPDSAEMNALAVNKQGRIFGGGEQNFGYLYVDEAGNTKFQTLNAQLATEFDDTIIEIIASDVAVYFIGLKSIIKYIDEENVEVIAEGDFLSAGYLGATLLVSDQERGLMYVGNNNQLKVLDGFEAIRATEMKAFGEDNLLISTRSAGFLNLTIDNKGIQQVPWGQAVPQALQGGTVSSIDVLNKKIVAIGSFERGVIVANKNGGIEKTYSNKSGLLNNFVFDVFLSSNSSLWAGLDEGVALIKLPPALTGLDEKEPVDSTFVAINDEDSVEHQNGVFRWLSKTYDNTMGRWFGGANDEDIDTTQSLDGADLFASIVRKVEYIPNDSLIFGGAFSQRRKGVQVLDQSDSTNFEFTSDFNAFRFSYSTNNYEDIEGLEYQVMLDGLDRDWSTWSNNTYREYTNLDWGEYTFYVRAKNAESELSRPAAFSFSISPPWYEATWFYLLQFGALLMALVISGILNKTGRAVSLSEALIAVVVIVIFQYVDFYIDPYLDEYSDGIAIFKVGISIIFGFSLEFIEELFHKIVAKVTGLDEVAEEDESEEGIEEGDVEEEELQHEITTSTTTNTNQTKGE